MMCICFFFQAEDGIRDLVRSRGLGDVYKRQTVQLAVRKENFTVILIRPNEQNFLDTLRNKLGLGVDQRN